MISLTDKLAAPTYAVGCASRLEQLALSRPITKWNTSIFRSPSLMQAMDCDLLH